MPVPVFCCFWFQKSYTGNILGIGRDKSQSSYFYRAEAGVRRETKTRAEAATPALGAGQPWPAPRQWCGPLGRPPTSPFRPYILRIAKTLNHRAEIHEKFRQRRHHRRPDSGDRSLCSGTLPGRGIAPGAISIDSTAISIAVADSHDEEGVVLPRG